MMDRLLAASVSVLAAVVALVLAVHLLESVAAALVTIVAVIGGLLIIGFVVGVAWRRRGNDRW